MTIPTQPVDLENTEPSNRETTLRVRQTTHQKWQANEGIGVVKGFFVEDIRTLQLDSWERMGGAGLFVELEGVDDGQDAYVFGLAPGKDSKVQRHMFEELVYVVSGHGTTDMWNDPEHKAVCQWQAGSVFAIPPNASFQHHNSRDGEARFLAITSAPLVMNFFHDDEFVFNNPFAFTSRFDGRSEFFDASATKDEIGILETNFVPDVLTMHLPSTAERGGAGSGQMFEIARGTMAGHVSEFAPGMYKKAHRHGPGAHVVILSGTGYSLLWQDGKEPERVDWKVGSLVVPPERWFHQHFNTSKEPARYLAFRWEGRHNPMKRKLYSPAISVKLGGDQIEYEDEDASVLTTYRAELERQGLTDRMSEVLGR